MKLPLNLLINFPSILVSVAKLISYKALSSIAFIYFFNFRLFVGLNIFFTCDKGNNFFYNNMGVQRMITYFRTSLNE